MENMIDKNIVEYKITQRNEDELPIKRELALNGCAYSIYLSTTEDKEDMAYLTKMALKLLKDVSKQEEEK